MLLNVALALLVAWLAGVLGPYEADSRIHVLLLLGLLLFLIGVLKARDAAAVRRRVNSR